MQILEIPKTEEEIKRIHTKRLSKAPGFLYKCPIYFIIHQLVH